MPGTRDRGSPRTILAFDFGLRRIGVAVGQTVTGSATAVGTVRNGAACPDWTEIDRLVREWQADTLVVGMPHFRDGTRATLSASIEKFAARLGRYCRPVALVDESDSSLEAREALVAQRRAGLRGRIGRETVDAQAAALIAERWLRRHAEGAEQADNR